MEQIDENTRIYSEGEHIIQYTVRSHLGKIGNYGINIECPYGYKLAFMKDLRENYWFSRITACYFVNEVPVECKKESINTPEGDFIGYFNPGKVINEMNLRKKY